jgi:hypothetical protein
MTTGHQASWTRLQKISCTHAAQLWQEMHKPESMGHKPNRHNPGCYVPNVIRENVEILGKGSEEDVKARVLWYITYYPSIFTSAIQG